MPSLKGALLGAAATLLLCPSLAGAQSAPQSEPMGRLPTGPLPDWTGMWEMQGGTTFDHATIEPPDGRAGIPGSREHPPYNAEWEKKYVHNNSLVVTDHFPDPISTCGTPAGMPRALNVPDSYEFVDTPKQTWILTENGPNIVRIFTDGRQHFDPDVIWPTYTGDSIGHWEGDTLVFDTIGLMGEKGTIVDRSGIVLSQQAHVITRLRRLDAQTMESDITVLDPTAFTKPWHVVKRYRRMKGDVRIQDYSCAENNRNPISASGKTLTLGSDGKPIDKDR